MKRIYLCIILLNLCMGLAAQEEKPAETIERIIADIFEQYTAETEQSIDYESFYNDLMELAQNPIAINTATKEELEKMPFLSALQVENILFYLYKFGQMHSIYELQLVDGLDMTDVRRMLPFVTLGDAAAKENKLNLKNVLKYGKNDVFLRLDRDLEKKTGYETNDAGEKPYLGSSLYNSIKYKFRYKDRLALGVTLEKDAGEPFWTKKNKGYDFYSFHAQINNTGLFKTIVLGDYSASFGQGLVFGSGFSVGKSSYVLNVAQRTTGLKKYSSTDEINFFRGAGATFKYKKLDITAFYSAKKIDGDTAAGAFASVYRTGLHRTANELEKKHTVWQQSAGFNAGYMEKNLQIGFTAAYLKLDHKLEPDSALYNYFYFRGNRQFSLGFNYRFRWNKFYFFGETASTGSKSVATINGCTFAPVSRVNLLMLFRYYSPSYDAYFSRAFSEGSRVGNQRALYLATEVRPIKRWKISAYADNYKFLWPRYGTDIPSVGKDYLVLLEYAPRRDISMQWRIKTEKQQQNVSGSTTPLTSVTTAEKSSARYQLSYSIGSFSFRNVIEGNMAREGLHPYSYGIMALQDLSYTFRTIPLKVDVRYHFFDAAVYDNRLYAYEKDILYAFSIPAFYGVGARYYLNMSYEINKQLTVWMKIAQTTYSDDREITGTGTEQIRGNRSTDVRFLIKWEF
ncbi:MAG: hypothetical protein H6Q20_1144 [Bacteroidetes bacterium]|nr:hypothetical protein [Bacteroidota bacterium]